MEKYTNSSVDGKDIQSLLYLSHNFELLTFIIFYVTIWCAWWMGTRSHAYYDTSFGMDVGPTVPPARDRQQANFPYIYKMFQLTTHISYRLCLDIRGIVLTWHSRWWQRRKQSRKKRTKQKRMQVSHSVLAALSHSQHSISFLLFSHRGTL